MKKVIGILGVAVFAFTMLINSTQADSNSIADQIALSVATAKQVDPDADECSAEDYMTCVVDFGDHTHTIYNCEPDTWYTLADCY